VRTAVLTVSDGVHAGEREDRSGDALEKLLRDDGYEVVRRIVPDEREEIEIALGELAAEAVLVLTTGGTGFAPRDVTPEATRALLEDVAWQLDHAGAASPAVVAAVCMAKNTATRTMQFCADAAVQTLGGMGYMRGTKSERIYREVKVNMIGGGAEEIMKDLAARQLAL